MTNKDLPPEVFLDHRVARTMPIEPDQSGNLVRYFSADRVKELVNMARGGPEFFVQITTPPETSAIYALTNYGRIFIRCSREADGVRSYVWQEEAIPDLSEDQQGGDHA